MNLWRKALAWKSARQTVSAAPPASSGRLRPGRILLRLLVMGVASYLAAGFFYDWLLSGLATERNIADRVSTSRSAVAAEAAAPAVPAELRHILERNMFQGTSQRPLPRAGDGDDAITLMGTVVGTVPRAVLRLGQQQGLYREGDSIGGARLERIERHQVVLKRQGREEILTVESRRPEAIAPGRPVEAPFPVDEGEGAMTEALPRPLVPALQGGEQPSRPLPMKTAVKPDPTMLPGSGSGPAARPSPPPGDAPRP